jgi:hypothetical protein
MALEMYQPEPELAPRGEEVVRRFFQSFCEGRLAQARAMTSSQFDWFGRPLRSDEWESDVARRFCSEKSMSCRALRHMPAAALSGLFAVAANETLWLVDLMRDDTLITIGVAVRELPAKSVIAKVFDPMPLAHALVGDF